MEKVYLPRTLEQKLLEYQRHFPALVIIGPRQVGKTSLVRSIRNQLATASVYLDLERPRDLQTIDDLELFVQENRDKVIILDEIQRKPSLFPELRSLIDEDRRSGRFILLGSATLDLIRDASESLAGRIAILELTGLTYEEVATHSQMTHWLRGGFPDSYLAANGEISMAWREFFVRTYLERDLISYGLGMNAGLMRSILSMLSHLNGQQLNYQTIAKSLAVDGKTVRRYVRFLEQTFLLRILPTYHTNVGKRLVKTPKVYFRDTGLLHYLLGIETTNDLLGHPARGGSFEAYAMEQMASVAPRGVEMFYYRTTNGAEIDIVVLKNGLPHAAVEIKSAFTAKPTRGFYSACRDLNISRRYLLAPGENSPLENGSNFIPLSTAQIKKIYT